MGEWEDQPDPAEGDTGRAIAEVRLPGFTFASKPGIVAVSIRIVQGSFRVGPARLRSPDGRTRPVMLLGVAHVHEDFAAPGAVETWLARLQAGVAEVFLDGVTAEELMEGRHLLQEASIGST